MPTLDSFFSEQGALSSALKGYQVRKEQVHLAETIARQIERKSVLCAEAGTGIGKTFAYLFPLLLSAKKALISTATKTLQEQIFYHDIPFVQKILGNSRKIALLKGRRNYLCYERYEHLAHKPPQNAQEQKYRQLIDDFAVRSKDGDLAQLDIPENHDILRAVSCTAEQCLNADCPFFAQCFVQKARQKAKDADLIVVNHYLLLADLVLKNDGFTEILPEIETFIIDEAHHLPTITRHFSGITLSQRQCHLWLKEFDEVVIEHAPDALTLRQAIKTAQNVMQQFPSSLQIYDERILEMPDLQAHHDFWEIIAAWQQALMKLLSALQPQLPRAAVLHTFERRLETALNSLDEFLALKDANESSPETPEAKWVEVRAQHLVLNRVPVNAALQFGTWIERSDAAWCFLSATLTINQSFTHFCHELGLNASVETLYCASPFDYPKQALMYQPTQLPNPNHPQYTESFIAAVLPILRRSQGRSFLLFTSYRALKISEKLLTNEEFALFVQGSAPKTKLLADFCQTPNALLLATASFWEGVDVRGKQLVCVMIDKLPFAAPDDPVSRERHRLLEEQGLSPFMHDTLPQAVISLKQGVGRLIRDQKDYGVLVIGDPRLRQKSYGKIFLESLPRMTRTSKLDIVYRFFNYHEHS